jgi:hypothetical protein
LVREGDNAACYLCYTAQDKTWKQAVVNLFAWMDSGKPQKPSVMTANIPAEIRTYRIHPYLKTSLFGNVALESLDKQSAWITIFR